MKSGRDHEIPRNAMRLLKFYEVIVKGFRVIVNSKEELVA